MYNVNPGFVGDDSSIVANFVSRSYLSGYDGNPRNNLVGIHGAINNKIGLGLKLMSDTKGEFEVSRYDLMGSYKVQFNQDIYLRFGLTAGLVRRNLNNSVIAGEGLIDQNDPVMASGYFDETHFVAGAGVLIDAGDIKFGLSMPNIAETSETNENNPNSYDFLVASFSYRHDLEYNGLHLTPSMIYQNMTVIDDQIDFYMKLDMDYRFWVVAGYQTTNLATYGGGFALGPFEIGYIRGIPVGQLSDISSNLNEIMLQIKFDNLKPRK
jgi:type IX secretion system PorP/SprF family membrane protein